MVFAVLLLLSENSAARAATAFLKTLAIWSSPYPLRNR
jgi:hypothetical protein